jgi:hypothetical protein
MTENDVLRHCSGISSAQNSTDSADDKSPTGGRGYDTSGTSAFAELEEKIESQTVAAVEACLDDFGAKLDGLVARHTHHS